MLCVPFVCISSLLPVMASPRPWYLYAGAGAVAVWMYPRVLVYVLVAVAVSVVVVGGGVYFAVAGPVPPRATHKPVPRVRFAGWSRERMAAARDARLDSAATRARLASPAVTELFLLGETIDQFVELVLQEFVHSWYRNINKAIDETSDPFTDLLRSQLRLVVGVLDSRLREVDVADMVVLQLLPIATEHFARYVDAEAAVRNKSRYSEGVPPADSTERHRQVAARYNRGKLHPAVAPNANPASPQAKQQWTKYLRKRVQRLIPLLVSRSTADCQPVVIIVRELLVNLVLGPTTTMLADPDFYNQLIVKVVGSTLQDRAQVQQLRAALDRQSHTLKHQRLLGKLRPAVVLDRPRLSQVLLDPTMRQPFQQYMDTLGRGALVGFWVAVQGMRNPLEEPLRGTLGRDRFHTLTLGTLVVRMSGVEQEVRGVYERYLKPDDVRRLLQVPATTVEAVAMLVESDDVEEAQVASVRRMLVKSQTRAADLMALDFDEYASSGQLSLGTALPVRQPAFTRIFDSESPVMGASEPTEEALVHTLSTAAPPISDAVINAVEAVLSDIVTKQDRDDVLLLVNRERHEDSGSDVFSSLPETSRANTPDPKRALHLMESLRKDLMGFGTQDDPALDPSNPLRLFDDPDDAEDSLLIDELSQSVGPGLDLEGSVPELLLAAPGNLHLREEIELLESDIERLGEQQAILEPLVLKAQLTNNTRELRVLAKAKVSLERELQAKELQRQQFIVQENDNLLYGKLRVRIQTYVKDTDPNGKEFVAYIIEVQKLSLEGKVVAGWVVARRFSQFYTLYRHLRKHVPQVADVRFPSKKVIMRFQERAMLQQRQHQLQAYLQQMLANPQVCQNVVFRLFLSTEEFYLSGEGPGAAPVPPPLAYSSRSVANRLYDAVLGRFPLAAAAAAPGLLALGEEIQEMQAELSGYDEGDKVVFVKPICDLLIVMFNLNAGGHGGWLRARAVLVVLQQVLGNTIEHRCRDLVSQMVTAEVRVLDHVQLLLAVLFPNGKFRESGVPRTLKERGTAQLEAKLLLETMMGDVGGRVFGRLHARYAATMLFAMLQNETLNRHLVYELVDEVLATVFPEHG